MKSANAFLPLIAVVVLVWMVFTIFNQTTKPLISPKHSIRSSQLASIPQGFKRQQDGKTITPTFDPRFAKLDPISTFRVPLARTFSAPMGAETGAFTYNAQSYWENNPHRRGHHTGDDLNGIGGWNSDLGDPVYSIANGLVAYAGVPGPGWGKVIIIMHRVHDTDGNEQYLQSMYAHLEHIQVTVDQLIERGTQIGSVGDAEGQYLAHLHFEIRHGLNLHIGPGYLRTPRTHLNPQEFLDTYLADQGIFAPPFKAQQEKKWQDLEIKNPEILLDLLSE